MHNPIGFALSKTKELAVEVAEELDRTRNNITRG